LSDCQENQFPQDTCLAIEGGGSAMAQCTSYGLVMNIYESSDCSGQYEQEVDPIDVCFEDSDDSYVYNVCPGETHRNSGKAVPHGHQSFRLPTIFAQRLKKNHKM
jgi:hypothetical protein